LPATFPDKSNQFFFRTDNETNSLKFYLDFLGIGPILKFEEKTMDDEVVRTSKFLSLVLRHKPEVIGPQLDKNGWASVEELLSLSAENGRYI
jgi:hypothetical protein